MCSLTSAADRAEPGVRESGDIPNSVGARTDRALPGGYADRMGLVTGDTAGGRRALAFAGCVVATRIRRYAPALAFVLTGAGTTSQSPRKRRVLGVGREKPPSRAHTTNDRPRAHAVVIPQQRSHRRPVPGDAQTVDFCRGRLRPSSSVGGGSHRRLLSGGSHRRLPPGA
jgi:hypothetical protein